MCNQYAGQVYRPYGYCNCSKHEYRETRFGPHLTYWHCTPPSFKAHWLSRTSELFASVWQTTHSLGTPPAWATPPAMARRDMIETKCIVRMKRLFGTELDWCSASWHYIPGRRLLMVSFWQPIRGMMAFFFEKWRYNRITTDVEVIIQNEVLGS